MRCRVAWSFGVAVACLALVAPARASASETSLHQTLQWPWLIDRGARYLARYGAVDTTSAPRMAILAMPDDAPVLGSRVAVGLLFGNWGSTMAILGGDQRSALDFVSVNWTSRVVLERVTLGGGWIQPFAQLGLGQWRKDADRKLDGDVWYGLQYAAGVQLRASSAVALAVEAEQAYVQQGSFELRGDFRAIRAAFLGVRVQLLP